MNDVFITYRHFRLRNENGEIIPQGGATIAFFVDLRDPDYRYAIANFSICSNKDHFDKGYGRSIAYSRLNEHRTAMKRYGTPGGFNLFEIGSKEDGTLCSQLLEHMAEHPPEFVNYGTYEEFYRWCKHNKII